MTYFGAVPSEKTKKRDPKKIDFSRFSLGITFAAVMGSLAALALVLLIRRERAGGK